MAGRSASFGVMALAVGCALGCGYSGPMTLVGYRVPKRQPVAIVLDISDQVNEADQGGAIATLADTLTDRLKEHGIESQLYTSKYDHPKPPLVEVFVSHWQAPLVAPGVTGGASAAAAGVASATQAVGVLPLVGAASLGASYNTIVLDCKVILPGQDKPVLSRHFETSGFVSNSSANSANGAAESAGDAIAKAILRR